MTVNGFSNFICLTIWEREKNKSMPGFYRQQQQQHKCTQATHSDTEFLWHMAKSRWHRFDHNNMALIHMLFSHSNTVYTRHRSPRAVHTHIPEFYFSIYISFAHEHKHARAPIFFFVYSAVVQFFNVQCKFHIYFDHFFKKKKYQYQLNMERVWNV